MLIQYILCLTFYQVFRAWNDVKYSCRECGVAFKEKDRIGVAEGLFCKCWFHSGCMVKLIDSGKITCSKHGVVWELAKSDDEMMEAAEKADDGEQAEME